MASPPAGLRWAFTTIDYFYWQPLTWLSHMVDCQILRPAPGLDIILVSLLFHVANALTGVGGAAAPHRCVLA